MKKMLTITLISLVSLVVVILLTISFTFNSKDHSKYDLPKHANTGKRSGESPELPAIDYRLMPEISHLAGIEDCRNTYKWVLENGPEGRSKVESLIIVGDSSGGNLQIPAKVKFTAHHLHFNDLLHFLKTS